MLNKSLYKIGDLVNGGIVFSVSGSNGLVISIKNLSDGDNYGNAQSLCSNFSYGGFNDWRLPSIEELKLIDQNLYKKQISNIKSDYYWSQSLNTSTGLMWFYNFKLGLQNCHCSLLNNSLNVRAVRSF